MHFRYCSGCQILVSASGLWNETITSIFVEMLLATSLLAAQTNSAVARLSEEMEQSSSHDLVRLKAQPGRARLIAVPFRCPEIRGFRRCRLLANAHRLA